MNHNKIFESVVGCAARNDFRVVKYALLGINSYIDTRKIIISVPDEDYNLALTEFSLLKLKAELIIKKDSDIINKKDRVFIKKSLKKFNNCRMYGWYIQQFAKLAMLELESKSGGCSLIWDMDTIPLRPLCFFSNKDDVLNCFYSTSYHEEYFNTIRKIFGLEKVTVNSFIGQSLPVSNRYYLEFINELEGLDSKGWLSNLILSINYKAAAAFSEYETIGTYIESKHPGAYVFVDTNWKRDAYREFIKAHRNIERVMNKMKPYYAFIAIEKTERSLMRMIIRKIWRFL